jgi:hypothetical protein
VEDHARGTLHYHILFFCGLSPYVLNRFSNLDSVCTEISTVLDTQYKSSLPYFT